MINDPGQHYHKDDMLDEPDIPGITCPNYDEHADYINECSRAETGDDISFECPENIWHINQDYFHVEAIDNHSEFVKNEQGRMVVTRLYGRATPIIRYTGIEDWIKIIDD